MAERRSILIRTLGYTGLFSVSEFYKIIDEWLLDKGYDRVEKVNEEIVEENSKQVRLWLEPFKKISDYAKIVLRLNIIMGDITEVMTEIDGVKKRLNKGTVEMRFEAMVETDYEGRLENRAIYFFLRYLFDRFFYRIYTKQADIRALEDANLLYEEVKSYLNIQKREP